VTLLPEAQTACFLDQAQRIGEDICRDAVWHEDRCNWVGAVREEVAPGQPAIAYAALGPDLYGGTSGVALFLAHLHAATGDEAARRSALGAIRQAFHAAELGRVAGFPGLFSGQLGIALAAAEVGETLDEPALTRAASGLALGMDPFGPNDFDLLSGRAGGIAGLLALSGILGEERLVGAASLLGDELLAAGQRSDAGLSWPTTGYPTHGNLTGFSHGAAGAGYALATLFARTGDDRARRGAVDAFAYEASLFDPTTCNWPDLRAHAGTPAGTASFAAFWCHGAPGIALSRLAALEVLGREPYEAEALAAVTTTVDSVTAALPTLSGSFSLCHGLAGNAEVLLAAQAVLSPEDRSWRDLAHRVARAGIQRYGGGAEPWPDGTYGGTTPNLFLGLAGIGLFYLRLHDPLVPTPLIPGGMSWAGEAPRSGRERAYTRDPHLGSRADG
jgi:lantibiotic modifying enzyme